MIKHSTATAQHSDTNMEPLSPDVMHAKDHYMQDGDQIYAGQHIIVDFYNAKHLTEISIIEKAFRQAIKAANATLLHIHLHHFTPNDGVSGVAVLAESHISVHTWPERHFAAFDIFMCGDAKPLLALEELKKVFLPERVHIESIRRGIVQNDEELV
ncbi:MAG: adenosylmethionine decarboxylase [Legionellales bacterium]|nr:adenosylmethionine decarboxylase [Legionellales bacterium]